LKDSKNSSNDIKIQLESATQIEENNTLTRNSYKEVSERGSVLYFVIADLAGIDPMYQYSLNYVKKLFNMAIENSEKSDIIEKWN